MISGWKELKMFIREAWNMRLMMTSWRGSQPNETYQVFYLQWSSKIVRIGIENSKEVTSVSFVFEESKSDSRHSILVVVLEPFTYISGLFNNGCAYRFIKDWGCHIVECSPSVFYSMRLKLAIQCRIPLRQPWWQDQRWHAKKHEAYLGSFFRERKDGHGNN